MFRDSESYLFDTFERLDALEKMTNESTFAYFFYENDSTDNTVSLIEQWLSSKKGSLLSEKLNKPKFSHSSAVERQIDMTYYRNRMLENAKPLDSNYTLILDSDVIFKPNLINQYLEYLTDDVVMVTPNVLQNIKCKMFDESQDSYYDSFALIDKYDHHGMTWASNPFFHHSDRKLWEEKKAVEVKSAFGGCPLIKTFALNQVQWSTDGGCEHWNFCRDIRQYGQIIVVPTVKVRVELENRVIDSLNATHVFTVVEKQKQFFQLCNITL